MSITFRCTDNVDRQVQYGLYSDNTPYIKCDLEVIATKALSMTVKPSGLAEFWAALALLHSISSINPSKRMGLVVPYLPGARQDRMNMGGDVLDTAQLVGDLIRFSPAGVVAVLDPHSPKSIQNLVLAVEYPLDRVYPKIGRSYDAVISPDKGAMNRAACAARSLGGLPVVQASKIRDVSDGKLTGFSVQVDPGKHYLVVDDICDGGGTFIGLGELIRKQGATADLFVTHGIFSNGTRQLREIYGSVITTDSMNLVGDLGVEVIEVVRSMEDWVNGLY